MICMHIQSFGYRIFSRIGPLDMQCDKKPLLEIYPSNGFLCMLLLFLHRLLRALSKRRCKWIFLIF